MKLEEMLEQAEAFRKETLIMSSKRAKEKIAELGERGMFGFVPDDYFVDFTGNIRRSILRGIFDPCVWEMVYNAARAGNKYPTDSNPWPHQDSHVILRLHKGKKGIVAEIEDQGEGIPERLIEMLNNAKYTDFFYKDKEGKKRGCGFANLKLALDSNKITAVGFNEKRNAIYLMALYR